MPLKGLDLLFWAAGLLGHLLLLSVLWRRHRAARFPLFTALIATNVARSCVLYVTLRHGSTQEYFYTYWSLAIADVAWQLGVVYEMSLHTFRPLGEWISDARRSLLWLLLGCLAIASCLTWLATPAGNYWQETLVIKGDFFSSVLMSELLVAMIALAVTVGLPLKTHVGRIAQGLGAYAMLAILLDAAQTFYGDALGAHDQRLLTHVRMAAYLVCLGYWIVTLWAEAPAPRRLSSEMRGHLSALEAQLAYDLQTLRSWRKS